jgi:predicted Zn-dependent protease
MLIHRPKILSICKNADKKLIDSAHRVSNQIADFYISNFQATGEICNVNTNIYNYGYMTYTNYGHYTNIYIHNKLLMHENSLDNVLLHEVLHSMGLDHSLNPGVMNYSLQFNINNYVMNDNNKLWLSKDDLNGLILLLINIYIYIYICLLD